MFDHIYEGLSIPSSPRSPARSPRSVVLETATVRFPGRSHLLRRERLQV